MRSQTVDAVERGIAQQLDPGFAATLSTRQWLDAELTTVPAGELWLAEPERVVLHGLRFPKRREDWRVGRWTAKLALAARLGLDPSPAVLRRLAVLADGDGAPEAQLDGRSLELAVSLSHRSGRAVAVVGPRSPRFGCDLEWIEPRSDGFVRDFLTAGEQARLADAPADRRPLLANLLWSAKESVLKAQRCGLRRDSLALEVDPSGSRRQGSWRRLSAVDAADDAPWTGWWRTLGGWLLTVVAEGVDVEPPIWLDSAGPGTQRRRELSEGEQRTR